MLGRTGAPPFFTHANNFFKIFVLGLIAKMIKIIKNKLVEFEITHLTMHNFSAHVGCRWTLIRFTIRYQADSYQNLKTNCSVAYSLYCCRPPPPTRAAPTTVQSIALRITAKQRKIKTFPVRSRQASYSCRKTPINKTINQSINQSINHQLVSFPSHSTVQSYSRPTTGHSIIPHGLLRL